MILYTLPISALYLFVLYLNHDRYSHLPDSQRYIKPGKLPMPFHLRWLLRKVCRQDEWLWNIFSIGSLFFIPPVMYWFLSVNGCNEIQSLIGSCLALGLPIFAINFVTKYMSDAFGILMSIVSAAFFTQGNYVFGIIASLIGSMASEKVFIFSFLFSFDPLALSGGLAVLARYLIPAAKSDVIQERSELKKSAFKLGRQFHKWEWFDIQRMVTPWGVCLLALFNMNIHLVVVLAVSYSQLLVATDRIRLYQWAFPVVVLYAVQAFPVDYAIPLLVLHVFNPFAKWYHLVPENGQIKIRFTL